MKKRVYRYFFDAVHGQERWLNDMARQGWRLVKCGQLAYEFERCAPGEYEYAVEFVAHLSYTKSKDYKAFLDSMGYVTRYKGVHVGIFAGKVKWRPWGEGMGQISTAPGSFQKELLIVEKKPDGRPFALHTDLTDARIRYRKMQAAYLWSAGGMFALALMLMLCAVLMRVWYFALGALPAAVLGCLWFIPARNISQSIRQYKEQAQIHECQAPPPKRTARKVLMITAASAFIFLFAWGVHQWTGDPSGGYSARGMVQSGWGNQWRARYHSLSGRMQRQVALREGVHLFTIALTTESGECTLTILAEDGTEYCRETQLQTSEFGISLRLEAPEKITLRIDTKDHRGGYHIHWSSSPLP